MGFESFDDICNTGLSLGLGCLVKQENFPRSDDHHRRKKMKKMFPSSRDDPFLTLGPSDDPYSKAHGNKLSIDLHRQVSSVSAVSSFSNSSVKKERDLGDEDDEGSHRKKLRLTKQQSTVLEDSFKEHTNLNPKLKKALADQLNLSPRQVEVWFQNRRARTKLKQTEVDFELLKKCCETLTEQNKRLQNELQELKSWKLAASYSMQLPAPATLAVCPSCERIADDSKDPPTPSTTMPTPFMIRQKSCFISPLSHPSAACS